MSWQGEEPAQMSPSTTTTEPARFFRGTGSPPWHRAGSRFISQHYGIHGVQVDVSARSEAVLRRVHHVLEPFGVAVVQPCGTTSKPLILRVLASPAPTRLSRGARPAGRHGDIRAWSTPRRICLRCPGYAASMDLDAGVAECTVPPGRAALRKDLLTYVLLLLLRRRGLYGLHASAVQRDGAGWLFIGDRGSGKSTQTYNLVRQGWDYLGDDAVLLRAESDAESEVVGALRLRRDLMLDPTPAHAYPECAGVTPAPGAGKQRMTMNLYADRLVERCAPRYLIFPEIVRAADSRLVPLSSTEALTRLVAQSAVFTLDRESTPGHLQLLVRLVGQCAAYRLQAGLDLKQCPGQISGLLGGLGAAMLPLTR